MQSKSGARNAPAFNVRRWVALGGAALVLALFGVPAYRGDGPPKRHATADAAPASGSAEGGVVSHGARARAARAAPSDLEVKTRALLGAWQRHASDLRQAMRVHPQFAEYEACVRDGGACTALLSDVLYGALAGELRSRLREGAYGVARLIAPETEEALHARLAEEAADSDDVVERVSALVILSRENGFVDRELPPAAYTGLGERCAAEVQLLLRRHRSAALRDPGSTGEVVAAAQDPEADVRIRRSAIQALGHDSSAPQLTALVQNLPPNQLELRSMVPAIASCGGACGETIASLMQSGDPNARLASYQAAALAPPPGRAALIARILQHSPPASELSPEELAERAQLLPSI
jgi:hypothetical protein